MSGLDDAALDRLLGRLAAPPPPAGLAERIRAEAMRPGREPFAAPPAASRPGSANRRRWSRPRWWVGVASVNLALAGAAAASIEVAHHGLARIAAIPATLFHRVAGVPAPHPHHAVVAVPIAARSSGIVGHPSDAMLPVDPAPAVAPLAGPAVRPPIAPVRVAPPAARQPPPRLPPVAPHHLAPAATRAIERHRPQGVATERRAAIAERHRVARGDHPPAPSAIAERADEAAKVREANLASRAAMPAAEGRPASAALGEAGERPRGFQRQPQRAARADGLPNRPAAARGGAWAQWRQQWQQQRLKRPLPHPKQGARPGGKRGLFRRRS